MQLFLSMKRMKAFLKNKAGNMYIDVLLGVLILVGITVSMINFYPVFSLSQELNQLARNTARVVEINGCVGDEAEKVLSSSNIKPDSVKWDVDFYNDHDRTIQLKNTFTVTLTKEIPITIMQPTFGSPIQITLTLHASASGVSEVYWK